MPDHPALLARLAGLLAPGGRLAVQVPANFDQPAHVAAAELAAEEPWRSRLDGDVPVPAALSPVEYARLLHRAGLGDAHVRLQVYGHLLASREDVVEWVKGTLLNAYLPRLAPALRGEFLEAYRQRLLPRLEDERPFHFPFQRILFAASRPGA